MNNEIAPYEPSLSPSDLDNIPMDTDEDMLHTPVAENRVRDYDRSHLMFDFLHTTCCFLKAAFA